MANNNKDNEKQLFNESSDESVKSATVSVKTKVFIIMTLFGLAGGAHPGSDPKAFQPKWLETLKREIANSCETLMLKGQKAYNSAKAKGKKKERPAPSLDPFPLEDGDKVLYSLEDLKAMMCEAGVHPTPRTIAFCAKALRDGCGDADILARAYKAFLQSRVRD